MLWNGLEIRLGITRLVMYRARRASRACDGHQRGLLQKGKRHRELAVRRVAVQSARVTQHWPIAPPAHGVA